jgi:hypothetical protein
MGDAAPPEDLAGSAGVESIVTPIVVVVLIGLLMYKSVLVVRGKCAAQRLPASPSVGAASMRVEQSRLESIRVE